MTTPQEPQEEGWKGSAAIKNFHAMIKEEREKGYEAETILESVENELRFSPDDQSR